MKVIATVLFFVLSPLVVEADLPAADCDVLANNLIASSNITGMGQVDQILTIKNGKAELNKTSSRILSFKTEGNELSVTFKRNVPVNNVLTEVQETVRFQTNEAGFIINYMGDANVSPILGEKATVTRNPSQLCNIEQYATIKRGQTGPEEVVTRDRAYCQTVEGLLKQFGRASFEQCHDLLKKISMAYDERAAKLATERKQFVEVGVGNTMQVALTSMNNCGPEEWYEIMNTPMGPQRVLKVARSASTLGGGSPETRGTR